MPSEWANGDKPADTESAHDSELRDLEDELCRLSGVVAVRIVGDRGGRPTEVHVLSDQSKPPKQTVRDVRSVAQTVFGLELDHRIVSVAQLDTDHQDSVRDGQPTRREARARIGNVHVTADGVRAHVSVELLDGEREHTGFAEGSVAAIARPLLVATATLDAIRHIEPSAARVHIASAEVNRVGPSRVALVTIVFVEPSSELVVSGSAVVRRDRDDAIARAMLDATNRRLGAVGVRLPP
jgi:hypothetical protein